MSHSIEPQEENDLMNETIFFNTAQKLDEHRFESFLKENFKSDKFIWVNNYYEFAIDNEIDNQWTYISLVTTIEGFKYHYSVFNSYDHALPLRERIEILRKLADEEQVDILSSDDEVNPWSWVLIEKNGQTSTIQTRGNDVLVIDDFYNFPLGDFRTKVKLTDIELNVLKQIIATKYPNIDIHHGYDGPVINGDFNKIKNNFKQLKLFDNHYEIVPVGKNEWFDKNEKSELFINLMLQFQDKVNKELCLFPRNYVEVKNIYGGSDSEEYCLLISKDKSEKIVYKECRFNSS